MVSRCDVLVVGGGPAGAATALLMARAGLSVQVLEKQTFPRAKPCGDCISPGANPILARLGVLDDIVALAPARLDGWRLGCGDSASFSSRFNASTAEPELQFSLAIVRALFDEVLLRAAARAGAQVIHHAQVKRVIQDLDAVTGVQAVVNGDERAYHARFVVGADGLRSRIARSLRAYRRAPRVRKLSLTAHMRGIDGLTSLGEMHVRDGACLGLAPVQRGSAPVCNVTVVLSEKHITRAGPHELMRTTLRRFGRSDVADLIDDDEEILASGPFDWPVRQVTFRGAALVGDAAGYFDPFTGQGIYQALAGAELLCQAALPVLRSSARTVDELPAYTRSHHRLVAPTRRLQRVIDFVCAQPRMSALAFRSFANAPAVADRLIAAAGDIRPVRDLLSPASLTSLLRGVAHTFP